MQGIEFETDQNPATYTGNSAPKKSWTVELLKKMGIEDTATANLILLSITAIFFGVTIFLYAGALNGKGVQNISNDIPEHLVTNF